MGRKPSEPIHLNSDGPMPDTGPLAGVAVAEGLVDRGSDG